MITPKLYETLPQEERRYWHTHVFEVKSGMLIMPKPTGVMPQAVWERAERTEMEQVVTLYGKIYHLWQVDRGDKLPMGEPQLMTSFTEEGQFKDMEKVLDERDKRFPGADWRAKRESRKDIEVPEMHPGKFSEFSFSGVGGGDMDVLWPIFKSLGCTLTFGGDNDRCGLDLEERQATATMNNKQTVPRL